MGPLSGIRVVELAGIGPAPFCGMLLADMGAEVIVVDRRTAHDEPPPVPHFVRGKAAVSMRGKRSIAMDLRHPEAAGALLRIVQNADALIEGFRPGVMERLGLGPEACFAKNGKLIYARMTGWGQSGPLARAAGHDLNYIALAGVLHCGSRAEGPPWAPPSIIADMGGGMMLAFGIACGLLEAQRSGRGQVIDAAMIDAAALLMNGIHALRGAGYWDDRPGRNLLDSGAPFYEVYQCSDGRWITLAAIEPRFYALLVEKLGLADDPMFGEQFDASRWPEQKQRVAAIVRTRSSGEWAQLLEGTDVCFAPVLDYEGARRHPHTAARGVFTEMGGVTQPAPAPRFSRTPGTVRSAPPAPGEHTDELLRESGFSEAEIGALQARGAIG